MNRKPNRSALRITLAAAAVLLLVASILTTQFPNLFLSGAVEKPCESWNDCGNNWKEFLCYDGRCRSSACDTDADCPAEKDIGPGHFIYFECVHLGKATKGFCQEQEHIPESG